MTKHDGRWNRKGKASMHRVTDPLQEWLQNRGCPYPNDSASGSGLMARKQRMKALISRRWSPFDLHEADALGDYGVIRVLLVQCRLIRRRCFLPYCFHDVWLSDTSLVAARARGRSVWNPRGAREAVDMNGHVLVLNQDYSALTVCNVQRAVILMHLQKVHLVESVDNEYVRSPSTEIPWPSIVRLKSYAQVPYKRVMLSRKNVLKRDGGTCQYCGVENNLTIDHVVPKSRGGRDSWENLVAACVSCNNQKGDRTPEEAGMQLARQPFRPSYVMFLRDFAGPIDEDWKPYLFLS